ncbi:MAG: enoyl-CoA hydratase/isomerase family protein [Amylibacter sp.]|nr:enoyl-CoA hydratase/isomerase family protein [Amylibacter sp.]
MITITQHNDIAIVTINNPPVNALSQAVRQGLQDAVQSIDADESVNAVILTCAGRTFIAGADVREFGKPAQTPHLPDVVNSLEAATKPWIAAMHGTTLGGGLEVALGCRYRIADKATKTGFPEVNLGLIPGAGGTVRLPRLIEAGAALGMIAGGKPISAQKALKLGLIDRIADDDLVQSAIAFAQDIKVQSKRTPIINMPAQPVADPAAWDAQKSAIQKKARGQLAPLSAITAIENALNLPAQEALDAERALFTTLKSSPQSAALRYIFFAERTGAKMARLKDVKPRTLNQIGIIGGGTMGAGIAVACLLAGFTVILLERDTDSLAAGLARVNNTLDKSHARGLITALSLADKQAALTGATDYTSLSDADMIIEAVFEDMAVKCDVFTRLDAVTRPDTILATNTSYLDVGEIAQAVADPSRVIGLHFFSPAYIMKLLEIVHPPKLADDVLATGFALAKRLGKIAIPAGVCDGFIGNRMMSAYRRACEYMLEDGALPHEIDAAMTDFGFPMGIFTMQDMAGLDIAWAMRKRQAKTRPKDMRYVDIPDHLCEMGRLGRKTGMGWYDYTNNPKGSQDPIVENLIINEAVRKGIIRQAFTSEKIIDIILTTMQQEGQKILDQGIAQNAQAIDVVMVNGYGFPRWRGGPMFMAANA